MVQRPSYFVEGEREMDSVRWKKFKVSDLFTLVPAHNVLSKMQLSVVGEYPAYSSDTKNSGILGYYDKPEFIVDILHPCYLIFGDHTRTMNIARKSFSVLDNVKVLLPSVDNDEALLYVITVWKKCIPNKGYARHWTDAKKCMLYLPAKEDGNPDWYYMAERIKELEAERIKELEAYLIASGLNDYGLTEDNKKELEAFINKKDVSRLDIMKLLMSFSKNSSNKSIA